MEENNDDFEEDEGEKKRFELSKESELRVECKLNRFFYVSVVPNTGTCEIFGSEIGSSSCSSSGGSTSKIGGTTTTSSSSAKKKLSFFLSLPK